MNLELWMLLLLHALTHFANTKENLETDTLSEKKIIRAICLRSISCCVFELHINALLKFVWCCINEQHCEQYFNHLFEFEANNHFTSSSYKRFPKIKLCRTKLIYFRSARLYNTLLSADILPKDVESLSANQLSAFVHRFRDSFFFGNNYLTNYVFSG